MPTLNEFESYLRALRSGNTARSYMKGANKLITYMRESGLTFATAPPTIIQDFTGWLIASGIKPRSTRLFVFGGRRLMDWLGERGIAMPKGATKTELPKIPNRRQKVVTLEMVATYLNIVEQDAEPFRTLLALLPYTGLRVNEACTLPMTAIKRSKDLGPHLEVIGKGDKERVVPINLDMLKILQIYNGFRTKIDSPWMFPSSKNPDNPVTPGSVEGHVRRIRKSMNCPWLTPHKMRHAFATMLKNQGVDINTIKELLGHESLHTTQIYLHTTDDDMKQAVGKINGIRGAK